MNRGTHSLSFRTRAQRSVPVPPGHIISKTEKQNSGIQFQKAMPEGKGDPLCSHEWEARRGEKLDLKGSGTVAPVAGDRCPCALRALGPLSLTRHLKRQSQRLSSALLPGAAQSCPRPRPLNWCWASCSRGTGQGIRPPPSRRQQKEARPGWAGRAGHTVEDGWQAGLKILSRVRNCRLLNWKMS